MNQSKVQSQGNVPLSWENRPGVCKETSQEVCHYYFLQKLPPPPPPLWLPESARTSSIHPGIKIPPPPGGFHPPSRSSSRRGLKKSDDDPFLAAYKECTKSSTGKDKLAKKDSGLLGLKKGMFNLSCKQSCSVRNDSLVRVSQLPSEKDKSDIEM